MGSELEEVSLAEVTTLRNGAGVKQIYFANKGIPLARVSDFTMNSIDLTECNYVDEKHAKTWSSHLLLEGDVVVATVGSWPPNWSSVVGKVVRTPTSAEGAIQNQNTCCILPSSDKLNKTYLYYRLKCEDFAWHAANNAGGSANQARLPVKKIGDFRFFLPSLVEQKAIANILGSLDDKIELNRQMNETLEAMAQALFKSWFVDFDPVIDNALEAGNEVPEPLQNRAAARQALGDQRKPLPTEVQSLFPDRFVFTEEMGWIPEGWDVVPLGDFVVPQKGKNITKKTVIPGGVPVVAGGLTPAYYHNTHNVIGPVITVSASGANAGYVNLYYQNIWASDCSYINSEQTKFLHSIYTLLKFRQSDITFMQTGAAQPHIYPKDLMRLPTCTPPLTIWSLLEKELSSVFTKIGYNQANIKTLNSLRDILLPKLLSGELRIHEAEKQVAEAL